ncbi:MAG: phage tail sheath subtilisin-like domain-containing protein [Thermoanaerobaculales bacterium]|nr:phage tail sheath subtilisin-like domain-containing protein [Thermoanaerobaculales bacterium]
MLHPGVYVQEIPSGSRSIEGAATSTTIFVGETERGPIGPTRIRGKSEYERLFGGYLRMRNNAAVPLFMPHAIAGFFDNGGGQAYVLRAINAYRDNVGTPAAASTRAAANPDELGIAAASPGVWGDNVEVTFAASSDGDLNRFRVVVSYTPPTLPPATPTKRIVEDWDRLSIDPTDESYVLDVLRRSNFVRGTVQTPPLAAIPAPEGGLPAPPAVPTEAQLLANSVALANGDGGDLDLSDVTNPSYADLLTERLAEITDAALIVAAPDRAMPSHPTHFTDDQHVTHSNAFITYVLARPLQDLFFVGDLPRLTDTFPASPADRAVLHARGAPGGPPPTVSTASNYNALYWPHIEVGDPVGLGADATVVIPPGGHVAGLYARTDGRRGVWKAPAGVDAVLGSIRRLDFNVLDQHQDNLNPNAVNALRQVPVVGPTVWGTRTRQPNSEWRYIPVRRTAIFLRRSIYDGIQWAVFEPNGDELWASLRATIGAFMETQFRNGAFFGTTSRQAYFVKCDAETTTEIDRAAGVVNILVGFAPLRPAEFVVVKLSQKVGQQS